jgi:hypothetical protein
MLLTVFGLLVAVFGAYRFLTSNATPADTAVVTAPAPVVAAPEPAPALPAPEPAPKTSAPPVTKAPPATPAAPPPVAAPTTGTIRIDSDVPGAEVFVDRVYLGPTPATAEKVAPGSHQFKVTAPGFESVTETIDVTPGPRDVTISLKTIRLNASLSVTHKHRFGSCKGTLTATADGIRYTTDNADDGFATPLSGIKTIDVDYLAKTLKLALSSGKSYTFTTDDGNADRLVVFQRDVQKARDKGGSRPVE